MTLHDLGDEKLVGQFSVAKATLESQMSCWDVVMLNQRCGYVKQAHNASKSRYANNTI